MPDNELAVENIQFLIEIMNSLGQFSIKNLLDEFRLKYGRQPYIGQQSVYDFLECRRDLGLLEKRYQVYRIPS